MLITILTELYVKLQRYAALGWVDLEAVDLTVCFEVRHDGPWVYAFFPAKLVRIK